MQTDIRQIDGYRYIDRYQIDVWMNRQIVGERERQKERKRERQIDRERERDEEREIEREPGSGREREIEGMKRM